MSKIDLSQYQTLVFDCDGVILNSNKIKTQAFYDVAKVYGHEPAQILKDYHILNGGISRYEKFEFLLKNILQKPIETQELNKLLSNFSKEVKKALLTCEVAMNIKELRSKTENTKWLIVSGGDQAELREVFKQRGLDSYFDGGIFGSPHAKDEILSRVTKSGLIINPTLFLGDSKYDFIVSRQFNLDFIFVSGWTEIVDWEKFIFENSIITIKHLNDINR
jgi:phosphoglycolate phosphatase-like HAD superfamily hydrolase